MMHILALVLGLFATTHADSPAVHGMLLFGDRVTYASHLPMFHAPHDYQALFELQLSGAEAFDRVKKKSDTYFTLAPKPMDLAKVLDGSIKEFAATIFEGHFERGGRALAEVRVHVRKIVHATRLTAGNADKDNTFLVFGRDGEYFAAHLIKGAPSYDAVFAASAPYAVDQSSCPQRVCLDPKRLPIADASLPVVVGFEGGVPMNGETIGVPGGAQAPLGKLIYWERDELAD